MKSNAPWSVKGIERDARETAKEAARREGMTVGEWLNQMIYTAGDETHTSGGEVEGLKLRDLITAIEHLRNRVVDAEAKNADAVAALSRNVGGFVERVQRLERVKPAEGSHQDLSERLGKLERAGGDSQRIDALKALEKAVSQVAVQFTNAQQTTLTRLDSAEQQLQDFAERIDRVGAGGEPEDLGALKDAIEGLVDRVARAERAASEAASLKDAAAGSSDPEFVEQTGARLRVLGDEIKRGGDQIRALENTIGKMSSQIEAAEKRSSEGVQKVAETIAEVRTQLLENDAHDGVSAASPDVEALVNASRRETEERIETLQRSFQDMNARLEAFRKSDNAETTNATPPATPQTAAEDERSAAHAADNADAGEADSEAIDEIEAAVEALEAEAEEDPFSFADDIETEDGETAEATEDFSFQLDDDSDEDADPVDAVEEAQSRLDKVRNALGNSNSTSEDEGSVVDAATTGEIETDQAPQSDEKTSDADEIEAILSELENGVADLDQDSPHDDRTAEEDEQAPNTASLTPNIDVDAPDEDRSPMGDLESAMDLIDEIAATDKLDDDPDETQALTATPNEHAAATPEASAEPPSQNPENDAPKEDYLTAARRRAQEAAQRNKGEEESGGKRPSRRNLTAKQRAILAARARQKNRLTKEIESEDPATAEEQNGDEAHKPLFNTGADEIIALESTPGEGHDDGATTGGAPGGRFAKIKAALSSARSKLASKKNKDDDTPTNKVGENATAFSEQMETTIDEAQEAAVRNGDRAALESIKSAPSARMVTLALGGAIIVAVLALLFLVKDFIFKPDGAGAPASITFTPQRSDPVGADDTPGGQPTNTTTPQTDLPALPEAPAIDPQALYGESIAALNAAEDDNDALAAIGKLQDAAALGYPPAQLQLGELFKTGQGIDQDLGQARVWFRRAANGGNVLAMHRIGVMTARGDGGPADSAEAIAWFERAANFGLVDSQYNLGAIYHPSDTSASSIQDAGKAYYWYSLAARNGDAQAEPLAAGVGGALSPDLRTSVDADVAAWEAEPSDPAANAIAQSG